MFAVLWLWLNRRRLEPSTPAKFSFGLLFVGLGFLLRLRAGVHHDGYGGSQANRRRQHGRNGLRRGEGSQPWNGHLVVLPRLLLVRLCRGAGGEQEQECAASSELHSTSFH